MGDVAGLFLSQASTAPQDRLVFSRAAPHSKPPSFQTAKCHMLSIGS